MTVGRVEWNLATIPCVCMWAVSCIVSRSVLPRYVHLPPTLPWSPAALRPYRSPSVRPARHIVKRTLLLWKFSYWSVLFQARLIHVIQKQMHSFGFSARSVRRQCAQWAWCQQLLCVMVVKYDLTACLPEDNESKRVFGPETEDALTEGW